MDLGSDVCYVEVLREVVSAIKTVSVGAEAGNCLAKERAVQEDLAITGELLENDLGKHEDW